MQYLSFKGCRPLAAQGSGRDSSGRRSKADTARLGRRLLAGMIGASLAAAMAVPTVAWAQSANATVRGEGPPNTTVTALNVATGVTRHARTSANGAYTLVGLPPGTYQIDAGPGTQRTVTLSVASSTTLNFAKSSAPAAPNATTLQTVEVTASSLPVINTSQVGATVSQHEIDTIPQVSRNFLEFADIVPGMQFSVAPNGTTSLRAGALNSSQINVYIDGVSRKSYVMGGAIAGQNASQGNPFPELAIGQYRVITSSYKAEYSQLGSAAITAATKSGTNEFHGEVFDRYTSSKFRARTPAENDSGEKIPSYEREFGFALGGPIVKDKAHFFVTYAGKRFNTPITVVPNANSQDGAQYLPDDVAAQLGPANLPFKEDLFFGKLDWEPTDQDRLVLTASIRKEHSRKDVGGVTAASAGVDNNNNDKRYKFTWDHSGSGWFNELNLEHQSSFFQPTPLQFGNGSVYTWNGAPNRPVIVRTGPATPLSAQNKGQKGWTLKDDLTLDTIEWHGEHVIKMGFDYRDLTLKAADAADVNPQFSYSVDPTGTGATPWKAFFTKPVTGLGLSPTVVTKDKQYGLYLQDDWQVNDKLLLNLGVRWDYEDDPAYTDFVTPANVIAALNSPYNRPAAAPGETYADALAKGGVDVNDYISNGHNRHGYKGEWQPRLGFSYDINADQQHVIHGGAGRAYDRNLYNYMQLETTKSALPQFTVYFQNPATGACYNDSTPCYAWDPSYLNGLANLQALVQATNGGEVDMLNNNLKPPYTDKFSLGMRNSVGQWLTDATVVRTFYHRGFAFTLGGRYPDGSFFGPNGNQFGQSIPHFGGLILGNNGIEIRSTEFLLSARKPFTEESGWGATVAYTFTHAKQNRDINEHYSFDYPTVQDYPFILSNAAPKHRLVATGSLEGPWGLVFGAKLTLATPTPWNGVSCYGPNSAFVKQGGGQSVTFPNGGHCMAEGLVPSSGGKFLLGGKIWGYRDVDFQITKNFKLGQDTTLYARLDLLNAFNFKNFSQYTVVTTAGPGKTALSYNPIGNITYVPRTIKFEAGIRF